MAADASKMPAMMCFGVKVSSLGSNIEQHERGCRIAQYGRLLACRGA
jgi:hypothetical protein